MSLDPYRSLPQAPLPVRPSLIAGWATIAAGAVVGILYVVFGRDVVPYEIMAACMGLTIAIGLGGVAFYRFARRTLSTRDVRLDPPNCGEDW